MRWTFVSLLIPTACVIATVSAGLLAIWDNDARWGGTALLFGFVTMIATLIVGFAEMER